MFVLKEIAQNLAMMLPPVRAFARRWHDTGSMTDATDAKRLFNEYAQHGSPAGKDVLELGPGQSFRVLQHALDAGAKSAVGLDVMDYHEGQPPPGISIRIYDGKEMPFADASMDLVWSHSCFEHIRYPELTIKECARVLRPGGTMVCEIDLKDHYHAAPEEAAEHLRYSQWLWKAMVWNRSAYTNRVRAAEWSSLFERAGFELRLFRTETSDALRRVYQARPARRYSETDFITTMVFAVLDRR
jgi:SAM-dependent methyltransferase